jgi:hypothetical protein
MSGENAKRVPGIEIGLGSHLNLLRVVNLRKNHQIRPEFGRESTL